MKIDQAREHALEHRPVVDHQGFDPVGRVGHDANRTVAKARLEIGLPQVGRLHHMRVAIDNVVSFAGGHRCNSNTASNPRLRLSRMRPGCERAAQ